LIFAIEQLGEDVRVRERMCDWADERLGDDVQLSNWARGWWCDDVIMWGGGCAIGRLGNGAAEHLS